MSKSASVIEINGRRYDAITGKVIGAVKKIAQPAASGSIDGFTKVKAHVSRAKHPASGMHKRAQKSKTLMRSSVKKPVQLKKFHKIINSKNLASLSPGRLSRAASVHRSSQISKYSAAKRRKQAEPQVVAGKVISPAPAHQAGLVMAKPMPSLITSVSHQKLERLLDEALTRADAHKQMLKQLQRRSWWHKLNVLPKWISLGVITLALAAALGIFAWERVPNVSLKVAASKAKISASVPAYKPDGFSVAGPVKYQDGAVVVGYSAGTNQSYSLSQKASDWDSVSLAANAIPSNTPVQSSQVKGTTVYIYGPDNDATWVNNGIRYTLKDKANLSSDQIINIAKSL